MVNGWGWYGGAGGGLTHLLLTPLRERQRARISVSERWRDIFAHKTLRNHCFFYGYVTGLFAVLVRPIYE